MEGIKRDPAGELEPTDICFCGHVRLVHPACGCREYQSIRGWCNATANSLAELIDALSKRPYREPVQ